MCKQNGCVPPVLSTFRKSRVGKMVIVKEERSDKNGVHVVCHPSEEELRHVE